MYAAPPGPGKHGLCPLCGGADHRRGSCQGSDEGRTAAMIYLDYSANTPMDPVVLAVYGNTEQAYFGNPNSEHPVGLAAREKLAAVTDSISARLGVQSAEIIYTSGASEANNLAVKGIARTQRRLGKHIITTPLEHPSVSSPLTWLQEQG